MPTMENDPNAGKKGTLEAPATRLEAITPHDTTLMTTACRAIYVGGAGDIAILAVGEETAVTLVGVPAGTVLPIRAARVNSTNTTATSLVALI